MSRNSKIIILVLSFVLGTFAMSAAAQATAGGTQAAATSAPSGPPGTRIGIVNIQDAIIATNEGKKEFDALQTRFAPKQTELKTLNDEVEGLKKQLQTQQDKLSDEERNNRMKTLELKQKTLQRNYDDAQSEFQNAEQEVVNRIGSKMLGVLEKYANANGYAVIIDVSNPQTPVLWAAKGNNITKDIVDAFNAESPVAAPAAKPAASAAPRPAAPRPAAPSAPTPKKP